jgi:hypothetical protein
MRISKQGLALGALWTAAAMAQPTLTTIQDVLYRADGSRFNGTIFITYESFVGGDTSAIATANLTVPVVNGNVRVRLVPTTTATAGARYNVTYNSSGINQFTETWAVPPSPNPLRVRDVRVGSGTVIGPPPVVSPVQIGDVIGLANELEVRPMRGVGYGLGRAAVINASGMIDGASGNLSDCVRVDGSAGPCGGGGGGMAVGFADSETPAGLINGANATFLLAHAPNPPGSLQLFRNGLRMAQGADYTLSGNTITFFVASRPQTGDQLVANYRYADPGNPLGTLASSQVVCSGVGASTGSQTLTQLASCTVPAGVLGTGDRLEIRFQMEHTGAAAGFAAEVRVGTAVVVARSAPSTETRISGRTDFGLHGAGQLWDTQTWGTASSWTVTAGSAAEDVSQALTVSFRGQLTGAGSDSVAVRNFTVIRHPAQLNP